MPAPIYSTVTVENVTYEQDNNFAGQGDLLGSLPEPAAGPFETDFDVFDDPVFAVGIHAVDPAIGSGDATNLDSLIGLRVLSTGTYTDLEVPIFPAVGFPELTDIQQGQTFPPNPDGETEVLAAIWTALSPQGLDESDLPDNADDPRQIDDPLELVEPVAVSDSATISELDQNPALPATDVPRPVALAMDVDNELDEPIETLRVDEEFVGGETLATLTGDPLPIQPGADGVFEAVAVVDEGTDVTVVAFDGDGNQLGTSDEEVFGGGEINPFFGSF
jgi:hypothetical protein